MNKYIGQQFAALRYEKNIWLLKKLHLLVDAAPSNAASSCPASACLYDSAAWAFYC